MEQIQQKSQGWALEAVCEWSQDLGEVPHKPVVEINHTQELLQLLAVSRGQGASRCLVRGVMPVLETECPRKSAEEQPKDGQGGTHSLSRLANKMLLR